MANYKRKTFIEFFLSPDITGVFIIICLIKKKSKQWKNIRGIDFFNGLYKYRQLFLATWNGHQNICNVKKLEAT